MNYRRLGKTGLMVSEIGLGAEWLERHNSDEEKDYASLLANAPRYSFDQGECTYYGHCRPCPVEIDIAMVNKYYDLASMQPEVPGTVRAHYEALEQHAGECMGCHGCESRCPFGIKIAERMVQTAKLFQ